MTPSETPPGAHLARRLVSDALVVAAGSAVVACASVAGYLAGAKAVIAAWWLA